PVIGPSRRSSPAPACVNMQMRLSEVRKVAMNAEQYEKMAKDVGFVAALDQSGGSTPKALALYGIGEDEYSGDEQMFELVHEMRTRIVNSPSFDGNRILAAILFENTMDRDIEGRPTADYLWNVKRIVPILKVDKGLADESDGAKVMKPMPGLDDLLSRAVDKGIFGTKMRSFISLPGGGLDAVVEQQFEVASQILGAGLIPIIEPEVDIHSPKKADAEDQLKAGLLDGVNKLGDEQKVMLKLTLPDTDNLYAELVEHPKVLRVLALSGGYSRDEACERLARNHGVIASFSRALTEGLTAQQSAEEFDAMLDKSIAEIAAASATLVVVDERSREEQRPGAPMKSYDAGPTDVAIIEDTIGRNLERTVDAVPDAEALVDVTTGARWTWSELNDEIDVVARGLMALGVE